MATLFSLKYTRNVIIVGINKNEYNYKLQDSL